jgi:hypothetical protein
VLLLIIAAIELIKVDSPLAWVVGGFCVVEAVLGAVGEAPGAKPGVDPGAAALLPFGPILPLPDVFVTGGVLAEAGAGAPSCCLDPPQPVAAAAPIRITRLITVLRSFMRLPPSLLALRHGHGIATTGTVKIDLRPMKEQELGLVS